MAEKYEYAALLLSDETEVAEELNRFGSEGYHLVAANTVSGGVLYVMERAERPSGAFVAVT